MSDANTFRCTGCGIVYSTRELADSCVKGDAMIQCNCGECEDCYRRRISTLETRLAELTRQHEADLSRASKITRGALADLAAARSRIAELKRELGAMAAALKDAVATNEELRAERDEAAKLLGTVVCIGTLMEGEELVTDPRHAATGAILGWRSAAFAARADLDEAVGLLERVDDRVDFATGWDEGSRDHNDVLNDVRAWRLARVAAPAPDKEP